MSTFHLVICARCVLYMPANRLIHSFNRAYSYFRGKNVSIKFIIEYENKLVACYSTRKNRKKMYAIQIYEKSSLAAIQNSCVCMKTQSDDTSSASNEWRWEHSFGWQLVSFWSEKLKINFDDMLTWVMPMPMRYIFSIETLFRWGFIHETLLILK